MQNPLVSIIVPIYNVEKYLDRCIRSIIEQKYENLEIILVNDGSSDSSGEICDNYAEKDNRINVIHKDNGGPSSARNLGIKAVTGLYLSFLDGDDYIENRTIEDAVNVAYKENSDVVIWGYYADFVNTDEEVFFSKDFTVNKGIYAKQAGPPFPVSDEYLGLLGYAWNKLYRAGIIKKNNSFFMEGITLGEDILFNTLVLSKASKLVFLDKAYTHYMQRPRVTLGTKFYDNIFELRMMASEAKKSLLENWNKEKTLINKYYQKAIFNAVKSSIKHISRTDILKRQEKKEYINKICKDRRTQIMLQNYKTYKLKEIIFLFILKHKIIRSSVLSLFRK